MATLSDSDRPAIGIVQAVVDEVRRGRRAGRGPRCRAHGDRAGEVGLRRRACRRGRPWPTRRTPAPPRPSSTDTASPPLATGRWNRAPAEARTHFGLHGSTEAPQKSTAAAPEASAARRSVPALPGSATSTSTRAARPAAAAAIAASRSTSGRAATAATPCGVAASTRLGQHVRRPRCGPGRRARAGRRRRRRRAPRRARRGPPTRRCPAASASATRTGPSITNAPSSEHAARRLERRRSRCTLGWRDPIGSPSVRRSPWPRPRRPPGRGR